MTCDALGGGRTYTVAPAVGRLGLDGIAGQAAALPTSLLIDSASAYLRTLG